MKWRLERKLKKISRQVLHDAGHARRMREDLANPADIARLQQSEKTLRDAWEGSVSQKEVEEGIEDVVQNMDLIIPRRAYPRIRENIEVLVVAICIAMGVRTYFIQPFKIPTGSMQPTLFGIKVNPEYQPGWVDKPPLRYAKFILTGRRYCEVRAQKSGYLMTKQQRNNRKWYFLIGDMKPRADRPFEGIQQRFYNGMKMFTKPGTVVQAGDLLARGEVVSGDHIFVDKLRYNFMKPSRGNIVVFRTDSIEHPEIRKTDHYIKRMSGMPGEKIAINPPHLIADGEKINEPYAFQRLLEEHEKGYKGYALAHSAAREAPLRRTTDSLQLGHDEFLPLGDNTHFSLDGRYFGGVNTRSIIGPAVFIYWPMFNERWGRLR